jgi:hypothetical protein
MSDIDNIVEQMNELRFEFGKAEDDYRQAKIDVAIEMMEECKEMKEDYQEAGAWKRFQTRFDDVEA